MKDIIYQLESVKTKCLWEDMGFDAEVLEGCIRRLKEMDVERDIIMTRLVDQNTLFGARMKVLQDKLEQAEKERDAAIADITEFAKFNRRRTICDFCKHDSEEGCRNHCNNNYFINDCFEWRKL